MRLSVALGLTVTVPRLMVDVGVSVVDGVAPDAVDESEDEDETDAVAPDIEAERVVEPVGDREPDAVAPDAEAVSLPVPVTLSVREVVVDTDPLALAVAIVGDVDAVPVTEP